MQSRRSWRRKGAGTGDWRCQVQPMHACGARCNPRICMWCQVQPTHMHVVPGATHAYACGARCNPRICMRCQVQPTHMHAVPGATQACMRCQVSTHAYACGARCNPRMHAVPGVNPRMHATNPHFTNEPKGPDKMTDEYWDAKGIECCCKRNNSSRIIFPAGT